MDRLTVHPLDASIKRLCLDSLNFALILSRFFELLSLLESVCSRRNRETAVVLPLWGCLRDVFSHYANVKKPKSSSAVGHMAPHAGTTGLKVLLAGTSQLDLGEAQAFLSREGAVGTFVARSS